MKLSFLCTTLLGLGALSLTACDSARGSSPKTLGVGAQNTLPSLFPSLPISTQNQSDQQPKQHSQKIMLFTGKGTWATEIYNLEQIFSEHDADYEEVNSAELNNKTAEDLAQYGLMIFPGGMGGTQSGSLTEETHARLRAAVQEQGVSYLGICAGAFIAVAPKPEPGKDVSYGFGVVDGPVLDLYYLENQGTEIAMTLEKFANGKTMDILWYGGPITPKVPGGVIATYPDGNPAITQMRSGKGFVILSGPHPTASQATLDALGVSSSDGTHEDLAWELVHSALNQKPMETFIQ